MTNQFTDLITSEHIQKPKFSSTIESITDAFVGNLGVLSNMETLFNIDTAVGQQLDYVGQWIGVTRRITTNLNRYFSWDDSALGWNDAVWWEENDPVTTVNELDDDQYRTLLKTKILCNSWTGSLVEMKKILSFFLGVDMSTIVCQEGPASLSVTITADVTEVQMGILSSGILPLQCAGIGTTYYSIPPVVLNDDFEGDIM